MFRAHIATDKVEWIGFPNDSFHWLSQHQGQNMEIAVGRQQYWKFW